ncbi:MAG: arylsulfatase [Verrucomicrobiales bacterium]|nr:arylsulfatase [Verrucomicrobiales bacterium]
MKHRLLFLLLLAAALNPLGAAERPNMVLFLIDDLGRADCGFMGGKDIQTPQIDKLAKSGAILDAFYVQPVCSPTRAALLTGRYPTHTGVYTVVRPGAKWGLPLAERILPRALHDAGYLTAICGKWHLGEFQPDYLPTRRGFDHQYGHYFGAIDYFTHHRDGRPDWHRDDKPLKEDGYSTHLIAAEACRIIREKPSDKPLFLYVPFNGIHAPHQVPDRYTKPYGSLTPLRRKIAGMLAAVDAAIGQITAALEEKGLRDNTLILFSSDNGGPNPGKATLNTPLRAGKGTIYEGGVRACAFASWPGKIPAGLTIREPVHVVDWFPTLAAMGGASLEQKHPLDGLDIQTVLTKGAKSPHDALLLHGTRPGVAALRMGDWKLITGGAANNTVELYNLAEDAGESKNLADSQPERMKEMRRRLAAFLKDAAAPGNPEPVTGSRHRRPGQQHRPDISPSNG